MRQRSKGYRCEVNILMADNLKLRLNRHIVLHIKVDVFVKYF